MNLHTEFDGTNVVRESSVKLQTLLVAVRTKLFGMSAVSKMLWFVAHVMLIVPDAGCDTLNT